MDGPWARQYQKDEQGETVLDEEGNPVVDREKLNRYQYNGKELTEDLGLNWNDYGARWYDAAIARFSTIDRFAEKYYSMTPYQYGANNPIKFIDVNGDSIRTYFYDAEGNQLSTVPGIVQQMFQNAYGISVAYNATTNMLYQTGTSSENVPAEVTAALGTGVASTELLFGYNIGYSGYSGVETIPVSYGTHAGEEGAGLALIDLADFNSDGSLKDTRANQSFDLRSMNVGRTFEHEYFGHGIQGYEGGKYETQDGTYTVGQGGNVGYVNRTFRTPLEIPIRLGYVSGNKSDLFQGGGVLRYLGPVPKDRPGRFTKYPQGGTYRINKGRVINTRKYY